MTWQLQNGTIDTLLSILTLVCNVAIQAYLLEITTVFLQTNIIKSSTENLVSTSVKLSLTYSESSGKMTWAMALFLTAARATKWQKLNLQKLWKEFKRIRLITGRKSLNESNLLNSIRSKMNSMCSTKSYSSRLWFPWRKLTLKWQVKLKLVHSIKVSLD